MGGWRQALHLGNKDKKNHNPLFRAKVMYQVQMIVIFVTSNYSFLLSTAPGILWRPRESSFKNSSSENRTGVTGISMCDVNVLQILIGTQSEK